MYSIQYTMYMTGDVALSQWSEPFWVSGKIDWREPIGGQPKHSRCLLLAGKAKKITKDVHVFPLLGHLMTGKSLPTLCRSGG